jgi:hypothetical protein
MDVTHPDSVAMLPAFRRLCGHVASLQKPLSSRLRRVELVHENSANVVTIPVTVTRLGYCVVAL